MALVPDRRTLIVLLSLVAAMTMASGLLLLLEPTVPVEPERGMVLSNIYKNAPADGRLFETQTPLQLRRWQAIVIHDSGAVVGSAATIDRAHRRLGRGSLGYHFVINGPSGHDGQIERGQRWRLQTHGAHSVGDRGAWFNEYAIGICLIGDLAQQPLSVAQTEQLVWLVQRLQVRFDIPAQRVYLPTNLGADIRPANQLLEDRVRTQLLTRRH